VEEGKSPPSRGTGKEGRVHGREKGLKGRKTEIKER
jgi:hypothetical protein